MRRLVNVHPLIGVRITPKAKKKAVKRVVKILHEANSLKPTEKSKLGKGIFRVSDRLGKHLIKTGKAVETKEYKGKIETKDFSGVSVPKIREQIATLTKEELEKIITTDGRKTAVQAAKEELAKR